MLGNLVTWVFTLENPQATHLPARSEELIEGHGPEQQRDVGDGPREHPHGRPRRGVTQQADGEPGEDGAEDEGGRSRHMTIFTYVFAFLIAIGVLVAVQEFGHFWMARRLGIRVVRFSIGFGRPLWRHRVADGTEYALSAIPLGGYVKLIDEREGPVPPEHLSQAYNRQPVWRRVLVLLAGPAANFLFAVCA